MGERQQREWHPVPVEDAETRGAARSRRRRWLLVGAATAVVAAIVATVAGSGVLASQRGEREVRPSPLTPPSSGDVMFLDPDGALAYVGPDGSSHVVPVPRDIADVTENVIDFELSPDGRRLALVNSPVRGVGEWVWVAKDDGTAPQRIFGCHRCPAPPGVAWSHDGTLLAYTVNTPQPGRPMQLRIRTMATGQEVTMGLPGFWIDQPAFSPDDSKLAFTYWADDSKTSSVATMELAQGLSSVRSVSPGHRAIGAPSWSQDGRTIYYTGTDQIVVPASYSEGPPIDYWRVSDLYAVDVESRRERQITSAGVGERFIDARPYGGRFLISRKVADGPMVLGWLTGSHFTNLQGLDGETMAEGSAGLVHP